MHFYNNLFSTLLARARAGDRGAQTQFRAELERAMIHMVRQTLRVGVASSVMARRILDEARRLDPNYELTMLINPEDLVRDVTQNLCADVAQRMQPRPISGFPMAETVCNTASPA